MAEESTDCSTKIISWGANSYGQLICRHNEDIVCPDSTVDSPVDVTAITGGGGHTALISGKGQLYTSGWNNKSQLGLNDKQDRTTLHCVMLISPVRKVACGWNHTLVVTEDSELFVFGSNAFGQLGLGKSGGQQSTPVLCKVSPGFPVVGIAAGLRHSLAVLADCSVWSWGDNKKGQLGIQDPQTKGVATPTQVKALKQCRVHQVAAGFHHSAALTESGKVYCWGSNRHGQCGQQSGHSTPSLVDMYSTPQLINGDLSSAHVTELRSGWSHLVAITDNRHVFTWGRSDYGQLGQGDEIMHQGHSWQPREVPSLRGVKQLMCGAEHNIALSGSGQVITWGWNEHGMCGTGDEVNVSTPVEVTRLRERQVQSVGCGGGHSFAVIKQT